MTSAPPPSRWKRIASVLKVLWLVALAGVLIWYVTTHWGDFARYAAEIGILAIVLSTVLLLIGKLLLAQLSQEALRLFAISISFWKAFLIYSVSQLGKYLPGSIWHFVGRVVLYRKEGLPAREGTKLLVIENFWLLGSAGAVGVAACADRLLEIAAYDAFGWLPPPLILAGIVLVLWFAVLFLGTTELTKRFKVRPAARIRVYLLELATWFVLGASFWALFPAESRDLDTLMLAVGAFALGWAAGYVAPFAPAGVGVREAIIVSLMAHVVTTPVAIAMVAFSRLIWTAVELALGAFASARYSPTEPKAAIGAP